MLYVAFKQFMLYTIVYLKV